jgi:hypothetical protein
MSDHLFVSYSSVDGQEFALHLADELAAGPPAVSVWAESRMDSPAGQLQALKYRLADAQRELPRAAPDQRARIQEDITELKRLIAQQQRSSTTRRQPSSASSRVSSGDWNSYASRPGRSPGSRAASSLTRLR